MKIMIATDGSDYNSSLIEECCKFIPTNKAVDIRVLSIFEDAYALVGEPVELSAEFYQGLVDAARENAAEAARAAADVIRQTLGGIRGKISENVRKGSPENEIVAAAAEWGADMVIVGSHGRGFWGRLLGSVSNAVVRNAPCPVLIVRPSGTI